MPRLTSITTQSLLIASRRAYAIVPAADNVNEGQSLPITVNTQNVPDGTTLYWIVSRPEDFDVSSGNFVINNDTGSFIIEPALDAIEDGGETFTVSIRTGSASGPIVATSASVTINEVPTIFYYPLSNTAIDPTYGTWRSLRAPFGYEFVPNDGIYADAPITDATDMFRDSTSFNDPDISNWDTSTFTRTFGMFRGATSFNQPLNNWDVTSIDFMSSMFLNATSFNQPLNNWDTVNLLGFISMFNGATSFNQSLSFWNLGHIAPSSFAYATGAPITGEPNWGAEPDYTLDTSSTLTKIDSAYSEGDSINIPAHQVGDLIILFAADTTRTNTPTVPPEFTEIDQLLSGGNRYQLAFKIADTADTVSGNWTNANLMYVEIYRNVRTLKSTSNLVNNIGNMANTDMVATNPRNDAGQPILTSDYEFKSNIRFDDHGRTLIFALTQDTDATLDDPIPGVTLTFSTTHSNGAQFAVWDSQGTASGFAGHTDVRTGVTGGLWETFVIRIPAKIVAI